ncbi:MAG TPA: serine hydrolase domain-containing protein [Kofleriaceae bacterium]|nr:serine hydrolase domain-containing protein [Kofleriaceae bacterium]
MPRSRWSSMSALAHIALVAPAIAACGNSAKLTKQPPPQSAIEVERYREQVEAQVQPLLDAELVTGLVIGLYDGGKTETYGFGKGPGNGPPDGATLFELGAVSSVYTCLVFADAVQRREIELDAPLAELLPLGVTAPIRDKVAITLKQLALHTSGLPPLPPSISARGDAPDPFAGYGENALYNDLIRTDLIATPGTKIGYSPYGIGLLGFTIGRKLGAGFPKLLETRVLRPLELKDTFTSVPAALAARRAEGAHDDLTRAAPWTYDALAGAGAVVSSARDQLRLIDAELDAAADGTQVLRRAMKLTQEPQIDRPGENVSLGWLIDGAGRYWRNGGTGGFHAFLSFDPKTRRGVVVLASTATSVIDRLPDAMYKILEGAAPTPIKLAGAAELAAFAGGYDLGGTPLQVIAEGKRLFLSGPGEPRHRLTPISDHEFWIEALQSVAVFEKDGDKVARVVFGIGDRRVVAPRIAAK